MKQWEHILGMGFAFKTNPEAFASNSCANKSEVINNFHSY